MDLQEALQFAVQCGIAPASSTVVPTSRAAAPVRWTVPNNDITKTIISAPKCPPHAENGSLSTPGGVKRAWNTSPESTNGVSGIYQRNLDQIRKKNSLNGVLNNVRKSAEVDSTVKRTVHNATRITPRKSPFEDQREAGPKVRVSVTQQKEPTFFIGGGNGTALIEATLLDLGWKRVTEKYNENFKLKWVETKSTINYGSFREGEQLVNRIPNCSLLTNKLGLLNSLQRYDRINTSIKGRNVRMRSSEFIPETYRVDDQIDRKLFMEVYQEGETWICKPAGMNQGRGIYLVRDIDDFKKILEERDEKMKKSKRPAIERIVQRYIQRPLLLEGRKFDVRAFLLVGCTCPYLILYHTGYVRRCLHDYKVDDTNLVAHLTNQFVQKRDAEYKTNHEETVWTMEKFNKYINDCVAPYKGLPRDWVYTEFTIRMKQIMLFCFNAVKHRLKCRMGYFDLYGLDFMIDDEMKVWLIEVNSNPCLSVNCQALKQVIPGIVKESLHISIECFEKVRKNKPILPVQAIQEFEILYCGNNARRKPGNGNRIEPVSPSRMSPSGFLTERAVTLSPIQRSRSLSPNRDFNVTVHTARSHQESSKLSTLLQDIHHGHIAYQTSSQTNQNLSNGDTNAAQTQQNNTQGKGQDPGQETGPDQGQPSIILNQIKLHSTNQYNNRNAGITTGVCKTTDQNGTNSSSQSIGQGNIGQGHSSSKAQRMLRLEERAATLNRLYARSHPPTSRSLMSPAMVGLWGTLPDLQHRVDISATDSIKFKMTHVSANSKQNMPANQEEARSPSLYLTPRHIPRASQSVKSVVPVKRSVHKVSLTGVRLSDCEKDILVDTKMNKSAVTLPEGIDRLANIKQKGGTSLEDTRHIKLPARRSAPPCVKDHPNQISTARVTDLSSELKVGRDPARRASPVQQQESAGEPITNNLGLENPAHARSRTGKLKNCLSPKASSPRGLSQKTSPKSCRKTDHHSVPRKDGRQGAS